MTIEQVWNGYGDAIKRFLHSKVSNPDDVEDLLQEILIKTFNNLSTVQLEHSVKAWLFQIANNVIIDFYRDKAKGKDLNAEDLWYEHRRDSIKQELSKCIEPFISALPDKHAVLLTAIDIQGESQKEYARKHGIAYSTLKSRVQKSRGQLRKLFEDCCELTLDKRGRIIDCYQKSGSCNRC